jgi:hypothetical protein
MKTYHVRVHSTEHIDYQVDADTAEDAARIVERLQSHELESLPQQPIHVEWLVESVRRYLENPP